MRNKKRLKPQHFLLFGVLALIGVMYVINKIPGEPAEPLSLPTGWIEAIKPEDLVDFGMVPQEKQSFELEAGKVAQFTLPPQKGVSINPIQSGLRIAYLSLSSGQVQLPGVFKPQQAFTLQPAGEQRAIYMMSEYLTATEFEVGPANLLLKP
jgi:hypothetical protein